MGASPQTTAGPKIDPAQDAPGLTAEQVDFLVGVSRQVEARRRAGGCWDVADLDAGRFARASTRYVLGFVAGCDDAPPPDRDHRGEPPQGTRWCPGHTLVVADLTGAMTVIVPGYVGADEGRGGYREKTEDQCGVCRMRERGYTGPVRADVWSREGPMGDGRYWLGTVDRVTLDPSWEDDFTQADADLDAGEADDWYRPLRRRQTEGRTRARVPELLGTPPAALVYPGRRTLVTGRPDQGKTWLSLAAAADVIRRRRGFVLWFDCDHLGDDLLIDRLAMLGIDDQAREDWFMVGRLEPDQAGTGDVAADLFPALVVFDGWNAALSQQGVSPLDESGVIDWQRRFVDPFLRCRPGCAVIVNDHVPQRSGVDHGYAYGAQGKVGQTDAHLRAGWAPGHRLDQAAGRGRLEVRVMRDRFGGHHQGGYLVDLVPGGDPPVTVTRATLSVGADMTERVVAALRASPGLSTAQVEQAVGSRGTRVVGALRMLEQAGKVTREKGPRNANLWSLVAGDGEGEMG